jgi:hypothetical protein
MMPHSPNYLWQRACSAALRQSDPRQLLSLLEYAVAALERRFAEWSDAPGTQAELCAIQEFTSKLNERLAWWYTVNNGGNA